MAEIFCLQKELKFAARSFRFYLPNSCGLRGFILCFVVLYFRAQKIFLCMQSVRRLFKFFSFTFISPNLSAVCVKSRTFSGGRFSHFPDNLYIGFRRLINFFLTLNMHVIPVIVKSFYIYGRKNETFKGCSGWSRTWLDYWNMRFGDQIFWKL